MKKNVKIADFGLSNIMNDGQFLKTSCGSPNYAAPEVIAGKLYAGPEVDVWSCGVILYALLCGKLPFDEESITTLFDKIKNSIYSVPDYVSSGAKDLISKILQVDPLKRATIQDIKKHEWFLKDIPEYLLEPISTQPTIDEVTLHEAHSKFEDSIKYEEAYESLKNGKVNEVTVAYQLLLDNKQKKLIRESTKEKDWPKLAVSPDEKISLEMVVTKNSQNSPNSYLSSSYNFTNINELRIDTSPNTKDYIWWQLGIKTQLSSNEVMNNNYGVLKKK